MISKFLCRQGKASRAVTFAAFARPTTLFTQEIRLCLSTNRKNNGLEESSEEPIPVSGEWSGCKRSFLEPISINVRGSDIVKESLFNKGTAFKSGERDRLRLRGLLPPRKLNIIQQKNKFLSGMRKETSDIRKNLLLEDVHDRNETLYHRILVDHIEEMAPLIYTPTVGQACQEFATNYRRTRGMYFTEEDRYVLHQDCMFCNTLN